MRIIYTSILIFVFIGPALAQWSTTNKTQDALFACPGFYSDILTYPDGSSIIIGVGNNNEIWAQKFDENGYAKWNPYVSVFSSSSNTIKYFLPDNDGGIYIIVGTTVQKIDKYGYLQWETPGKQIGTHNTNIQRAIIDGHGGIIGLQNIYDSLQKAIVFRYDRNGIKLWEKQIDSSKIKNSFSCDILGRIENDILIYSSKSGYMCLNVENLQLIKVDTIQNYINNFPGITSFVSDGTIGIGLKSVSVRVDSLGRGLNTYRVTKFNSLREIDWTSTVEIFDLPGSYGFVMPPIAYDYVGGVFMYGTLKDSMNTLITQVHRVTKNGLCWSLEGKVFKNHWGFHPFVSKAAIGFFSPLNGIVKNIDTNGIMIWQDSMVIINDVENIYFEKMKSDNNGGAIITFWTVAGGIKAMHTGRVGKVGVLTKVLTGAESFPAESRLFQNFPNPFNPHTTISFTIPNAEMVTLTVYDNLGRIVSELVNSVKTEGKYEVMFDASKYSSGVYYYKLIAGKDNAVRRMLLLK